MAQATSAASAIAALAAALAIATCGSPLAQPAAGDCGTRVFELKGYNANITTFPATSGIKAGELVEFFPAAGKDWAAYIGEVKRKRALPEWYWIGANCEKGNDCDGLVRAGVELTSTGTAEWNKTERRIARLDHPAVVRRAEAEMRRALIAAGKAKSDLAFRIDNMHDLNDRHFYDLDHTRAVADLRAMTQAWGRVVEAMRNAGAIARDQAVGLTAHNNFRLWREMMAEDGPAPIVLRIENPTQWPKDLAVGLELMRARGLPLIAVEFREGHKYRPDPARMAAIQRDVSLLALMENEDNYQDGEMRWGAGPKTIRLACR